MNTSAVAQATPSAHAFTQEARDAIYHAIFSRRDVRGQFLPTPVPDEVLNAEIQPFLTEILKQQGIRERYFKSVKTSVEE